MNTKLLSAFILSLSLCTQLPAQVFSAPPAVPVRTMAEWEELQALVITWKPSTGGNVWRNILTEITRAAREECKVIIICDSQSVADAAQTYLVSKGVDVSSNVSFLLALNNTIWVRDYGPTCVYANDVDSLLTVDWIYNRNNRASDDAMPSKIGQYLSLPVYSTLQAPYDLVNTGGNFMSDGMGTAFASKLVFRNNDQTANGEGSDPNDIFGTSNHTEAEIDNIFQEYMGINRYIKMDELPYDGIHHIDMHMKLLDEETLLVGEYPANTSDGPQIEANLQYVLSQFKTSFGHDFKLIRIPMPPFNGGSYPPFGTSALYPTYANAVFVNRTVIMPKYNIPLDAAAQDTFQKYLPGYKIIPVDCNNIINSGGAVHCISKEIGVPDPLLITHSALPCQDNSLTPDYAVYARIQHRSGIASAKVFFTTDLNAPWQHIDMQPSVNADTLHLWEVAIPKQIAGSTVYYYIEATAMNGKVWNRPITAPEGWWSFCVQQSSATAEPVRIDLTDIYPNPAAAITVVPVEISKKTPAQIVLANILGQPVETIFAGELPAGKSNHFFNAARFSPGVYFVNLYADGKVLTKKVVIR